MPLYAYEAVNRTGTLSKGRMEAESDVVAASKLRNIGLTVMEMTEVKPSIFQSIFKVKRKTNIGELSLFSRQLASMLSAGIPLTRCLYALSEQASNLSFGKVIEEVARNVESGMSFSESLQAYPDVFSPVYVDMMKAGELGGAMEEVLNRLANQLEAEKQLSDNIRTAMFYPAVIMAFAVLVLIGMLLFMVPVFLQFYPPDASLPLPTQIIVSVSDSMIDYWYIYLVAGVALIVGSRHYFSSESGQRKWDRAKFKIPVFGSLVQKTVIARFSRTLSTLLAGGIPILQAMETAGPASGSRQVKEAVEEAAMRIQEGQSIAVPLRESKLFPAMVTLMISVGEETGDLPDLLERVSVFYEAEVATMTKGLTSLIEPLMIIFVGGIVGVMVIALYLPIFTVITQLG